MSTSKKIAVIGGGAAGFFAAINIKLLHKDYEVHILEKTTKLLSKVLISGGGRCNVTNYCFDNKELVKNYPRGEKELMQVFSRFAVKDTIDWFETHGVKLKRENDNRMFPSSDESQTIIDCFMQLCGKLNIQIRTSCEVHSIKKENGLFTLKTSDGPLSYSNVVISSGGHPKSTSYKFIQDTGHTIIEPIPSLFTINLPEESIKKELQGVSVKNALVSIASTKFKYLGPLLITHWGLSGPAVLKLSAFAAKHFFDSSYTNSIQINWTGEMRLVEIEETLSEHKTSHTRSLVTNTPLFGLPKRIWEFLVTKSEIAKDLTWANVSKAQLHKLCNNIYCDTYAMKGKTTFKEEFVTAGGVDLKEIDFKTMQSKLVPGIFFCGEVLNIDGITGGFNFQAAWSTAFVCASSV